MDNSGFLDYLKDKGFYVASKSKSNYCISNFSIPSSLNFAYLDHYARQVGKDSQDLRPVLETILANRFTRILRQNGYRVASFSSAMAWTEWGNAEYYYAPPFTLNEFETQLLATTAAPLVHKLFGVGWDPVKLSRTRILYLFDALPKTVELPPPVFVFAHLMCPHPPALFGTDGPRTTRDEKEWVEDDIRWGGRRIGFSAMDSNEFFALSPEERKRCSSGYTGQVEFVNRKLKESIGQILSRSKTPPIIIIQGDHGSRMLANWEDVKKSHVQEHFPILNAYYFPDQNYANLYPEISPVNTFRVVLNQYFGTRYPLLEDRCYFSTHSRPYDFVDVTERVRNDSLVPLGTMLTRE